MNLRSANDQQFLGQSLVLDRSYGWTYGAIKRGFRLRSHSVDEVGRKDGLWRGMIVYLRAGSSTLGNDLFAGARGDGCPGVAARAWGFGAGDEGGMTGEVSATAVGCEDSVATSGSGARGTSLRAFSRARADILVYTNVQGQVIYIYICIA